jgi:NPCBM/NEW2 domain
MPPRLPGRAAALLGGAVLACCPIRASQTRLETLDLTLVQTSSWGSPKPDQAAWGGPIRVGHRSFGHGFGTCGCSELNVGLDGRATRIFGRTGVDDTEGR